MHGPAGLGWLLVAVCALAGAVCLARARRVRGRAREAAAAETAMAAAMALMALPGGRLPPAGFAVLFAALTAWTLTLLARRAPHQLHHVAEAAAMGYAATLMAAGGHHGGPSAVTGLLALYFAGHALHAGARLLPAAAVAPSGGPPGAPPWPLLPGVAHACRLALSLAMCPMLLL
ncbi:MULTISPECIES: DUF5134 domain-containing protein [Streptomyces]|uniref:DUF5134 domain-containing protein n=1 Tax=Streptomyces TaxID=1883 RepID=UPI0022493EB9|nr:DUF5134 domain-containing protein [Streptomyces sp. JHD 1]MCX2968467.1 DUF5134 domain-containing protein [Streptomyces sp. JHD 1]